VTLPEFPRDARLDVDFVLRRLADTTGIVLAAAAGPDRRTG
jgi:hypothetical protein